MKRFRYIFMIFVLLMISVFPFIAVGCSEQNTNFDVAGDDSVEFTEPETVPFSEQVKSFVTTDDKLVINYFDAYLWIVYFNEDDTVSHMTYIYEFESEDVAKDMVNTRKNELSVNKTMTITDACYIEEYVIIDLTDSSFDGTTRDILEHNFENLIVK